MQSYGAKESEASDLELKANYIVSDIGYLLSDIHKFVSSGSGKNSRVDVTMRT